MKRGGGEEASTSAEDYADAWGGVTATKKSSTEIDVGDVSLIPGRVVIDTNDQLVRVCSTTIMELYIPGVANTVIDDRETPFGEKGGSWMALVFQQEATVCLDKKNR